MPRIPRARCLKLLELGNSAAQSPRRLPFAASRTFTSTCAAQEKSSSWIRGKLWKGEAPGPEDPYTQRLEDEKLSNLPDEAFEVPPPEELEYIPDPAQESRLALPPQRSEAVIEKEVLSDPAYVPAETLDELEQIPVLKKWWEQPGHWGQESQFRGFACPEKVADSSVLEVYLRRAVVEVISLKKAGALEKSLGPAARRLPQGGQAERDHALTIEVGRLDQGDIFVEGDVASLLEHLTKKEDHSSLETQEEEVPAVVHMQPEQAESLKSSWKSSWKNIPLDEKESFAVRKRLYQLSGHLIPDHRLVAVKDVQGMLNAAIATAKWKKEKLADVLGRSDVWTDLPNVKLHQRRVTPMDKEIAIGRWKVIEEELKKRGLPVSAKFDVSGHKEKDWILGRAV